jgi:glycosyltransferase involved in cell wall biosynthesis
MQPFISILIPVYRVEKYIERCLRSVMKQTYSALPVECILIDDCGGDSSMQIAMQLINKYVGPYSFRIIDNGQNKGLATTRNNGLKAAQGKYIFFLDSDDSIVPDCLETLVAALDVHPEADVVIGNAYFTKAKCLFNNQDIIPKGVVPKELLIEAFFRGKIQETVWNMLIRADVVSANDIRFADGMILEDTVWAYRLYQAAHEVVIVPKTTLIYEDNPTSIMNTRQKTYRPHLEGIVYNMTYFLNHFPYSHYVDATLYIVWLLNHEFDAIGKCGGLPDLKKQLKRIRNRVFRRDLANVRLTLAMFELQLYSPFRLIQKSAWYRHHYHVFSQLVRGVALFFDPLHFLNPHCRRDCS